MSKKPRDMSGSVRCGECGAPATHERGPGSPLSIRRHERHCSEHPDLSDIQWANRLGKTMVVKTNKEVVAGVLVAVGIETIAIGKKVIRRDDIKKVRRAS